MVLRFRRLIPLGWEWMRPELARQPLLGGDRALGTMASEDLSEPGHYAVACLLLRRILLSGPNDELSHTLDRAVDHLQRSPASPLAHRMLGCTLSLLGRMDEALEAFERAQGSDDQVRLAIELDVVRLLAAHGDVKASTERIEAFPKSNQRNHWYRLARAHVHQALGDTDEALELMKSLLSRWPDAPDLLCEQALLLWAQGNQVETVRCFERIVALKPHSPIAAWNYAAGLILIGDDKRARAFIDDVAPNVVALDSRLHNALKKTDRPKGNLLSGDISAFSLPDVLNLLWHRRSSGTLVLQAKRGHGELHMWSGAFIGAHAPTTLPLAHMVSPTEQMEVAPFECGRFLSAGVTKADLKSAIRGQVQQALVEMLGWDEGHFHFEPLGSDAIAVEISDELVIPTEAALLEVVTQIDEMNPRSA